MNKKEKKENKKVEESSRDAEFDRFITAKKK
jgi:hypothetical protein